MADPEQKRRLTSGQASLLIRLLASISVLLVLGGILTMFTPADENQGPASVAKAVPREPEGEAPIFPRYQEFTSDRSSLFKFMAARLTPMEFAPKEKEYQKNVAETPTPPRPDVDNLDLVGTAPGSDHRFAVFADRRNGLTFVVAEGSAVRNAVLTEVFPDRAVVALGDQKFTIKLTAIPGSE